MTPPTPTVPLSDGHAIPQVGFGTWQISDEEAPEIVGHAIRAGCRHVDTAAAYGNEGGVGRAVREAGVPREEIFVTTKLWNDAHGRDATVAAFEASLDRLGLDHVDLYLIHWPVPMADLYVESWRAMIALREGGRARSIGVSNFEPEHLRRLVDETGVVPAVNQIELHPRFQQRGVRAVHGALGIAVESWSPLGRGGALDDPALGAIAAKHGRTPAQVVLRWHVEQGLVVIPRSRNPSRIEENLDVLGFALDAEDMAAIAAMDDAQGRIGPVPTEFGAVPPPSRD